jgi:hypothetical protein
MAAIAEEHALEVQQVAGGIELVADPEIDRQVATARRYPRSVTTFMRRATEMATLTPDIAASCIYALPRKENGRTKNIEGPSARFAEICASSWGNLRAEGKVLGHDDQFVTSRGTAWDVENNVAIAYEVKRRITTSSGSIYNADMIGVTGNAGASIALRNAILKAIPTPFWKPIYNACRKVIAGDQKTFASRRDGMLHEFAVMGVPEERILVAVGVKGRADITGDHMVMLAGFLTALRDGDTTIEDAFPESGGLGTVQPAQRKSSQQATGATATAEQKPAEQPPTTTTQQPQGQTKQAPSSIGTIVDVIDKGHGAIVKLSTGFQAGTGDQTTIASAKSLRESGRRVELLTKAASKPGFAPTITDIDLLTDEGSQA